MARRILDIAIEAAERDATAPAPTTLFDTNNKVAKILRIAARDTMREYLRESDWIGLSEHHATWAFVTHPGRFAYPLPPDFLRLITNTEHRGGWPMGLVGPATPQAWAHWLFGGGGVAPVQMGWRIHNGAIWVEPTPVSYELVTISYVSRYPVVSEVRPGDYDMSKSPPVCTAPFVPRDGQLDVPDGVTIGEAHGTAKWDLPPGWDVGTFGQEITEYLRRISVSSSVAPLPQVRRPEFESDDDMPAWADDHLLSLGMTFRLRKALGKDYAEVAAEYESELEMKQGSDAGGARAIRLGGCDSVAEVVPLGGGRWLVG